MGGVINHIYASATVMLPPQFYLGNATALLLWLFQTVPHEALLAAIAIALVVCVAVTLSLVVILVYVAFRCMNPCVKGSGKLCIRVGKALHHKLWCARMRAEELERQLAAFPYQVVPLRADCLPEAPQIVEPLRTPPAVRASTLPGPSIPPALPDTAAFSQSLPAPAAPASLTNHPWTAIPTTATRRSNRLNDRLSAE